MYQDKILICKDCGKEFVFSAGEQEFYAERGFETEPRRCPECRRIKKQLSRQSGEIFEIVCSECGTVDTIPFEPRHDRPVFCRACYIKRNIVQ